jgi:hypothetical protein
MVVGVVLLLEGLDTAMMDLNLGDVAARQNQIGVQVTEAGCGDHVQARVIRVNYSFITKQDRHSVGMAQTWSRTSEPVLQSENRYALGLPQRSHHLEDLGLAVAEDRPPAYICTGETDTHSNTLTQARAPGQ